MACSAPAGVATLSRLEQLELNRRTKDVDKCVCSHPCKLSHATFLFPCSVPAGVATLSRLEELELVGDGRTMDVDKCFGVLSLCTRLARLTLKYCLDTDDSEGLPEVLSRLQR